jgi:hypothetical protein
VSCPAPAGTRTGPPGCWRRRPTGSCARSSIRSCLEAPEPAEVPRALLRADGRSVHRRHGGVRYATRAQLSMEERLVAQAAAQAALRLSHAAAAQALGSDTERLVCTLEGHANHARAGQRTGSGLREDQAAAALSVLTDGRRVSVINAPAGAGKTRVLAEVAKAWTAAGLGPVVGITPSQSARNTLAAGVPDSYNSGGESLEERRDWPQEAASLPAPAG